MKKAIAFLMVLCMLLGVSAYAESDTLVIYFSCTGTTKGVAEKLAKVTGADLYEIVPAVPYTEEDLNYNDRSTRATSEQDNPETRPEIGGEDVDLTGYTTVYIGYPIWWGEEPRILCTFVENHDFTDGEAALELALAQCDGCVWLLGVLGGRPDHQLANLLLPLHCAAPERVALAGGDWQGRYLGPGRHTLRGRRGDTVSLLPLSRVSGLSLAGFEYPLRDHSADPGDSRTVSNVLEQEEARVTLERGCLLALRIMSREEIEDYERDQ